MALCVLALGSNLGDRSGNLREACREISKLGKILAKSRIYETKPVGYENQGDFLNAAIALDADLKPLELLEKCQSIELKFGRTRPFKDAPRTLDIDIIFYEDFEMKGARLEVPHPRWHERDFVLTPLLDLLDLGVFKEKKFERLRLFLSLKTRMFNPFESL